MSDKNNNSKYKLSINSTLNKNNKIYNKEIYDEIIL